MDRPCVSSPLSLTLSPARAGARETEPIPSPAKRGRVREGVLALVLLAACGSGTKEPAAPTVPGATRIASGEAREFSASADGAWVAWLDGCRLARGQYLPPGTANCNLRVAPSGGGESKRIAGAVTTLPQGVAWSRAGAILAALGDYDYAAGSGTLLYWSGAEVRELARDVTFVGFGRGEELGFVSGGKLSVLLPGEASPRLVAGADGVASFDVAPPAARARSAIRLLARRARASGGQQLAADSRLATAKP